MNTCFYYRYSVVALWLFNENWVKGFFCIWGKTSKLMSRVYSYTAGVPNWMVRKVTSNNYGIVSKKWIFYMIFCYGRFSRRRALLCLLSYFVKSRTKWEKNDKSVMWKFFCKEENNIQVIDWLPWSNKRWRCESMGDCFAGSFHSFIFHEAGTK